MLNTQKVRARHEDRLGSIARERPTGAGDTAFTILDIDPSEVFGHTYATLGAARGPLQHEIAIDATEVFPPYSDALDAVARAAPALAPGVVVPHAIPETPFTALLCFPFDDNGGNCAPLSRWTAPAPESVASRRS